MQIIRFVLGKIILFLDWLTRPKSMYRSDEEQQLIAQKLRRYSLYELTACPFCVKVRRECVRLGLDIKRINVKTDAEGFQALQSEGGKYQVPCLRVETSDGAVEWLYESSDIISRLRADFLGSAFEKELAFKVSESASTP